MTFIKSMEDEKEFVGEDQWVGFLLENVPDPFLKVVLTLKVICLLKVYFGL